MSEEKKPIVCPMDIPPGLMRQNEMRIEAERKHALFPIIEEDDCPELPELSLSGYDSDSDDDDDDPPLFSTPAKQPSSPVLTVLTMKPKKLCSQSENEKESRIHMYSKRVKSRNTEFRRMSKAEQKFIINARFSKEQKKLSNKTKGSKPLDNHTLSESLLGFVNKTYEEVHKVKATAATVSSITEKIRNTQEFLRYKETPRENMSENAVARLEDLVMFMTGLFNCKNFLGFLSYLHLYLRTFFTESLVIRIIGLVTEVLGMSRAFACKKGVEYGFLYSQSGEEDEDQDDFIDMLDQIKFCIRGWKTHKRSPLAKNICNVINILVTFGFMPDLEENPIKLRGFQLFQAKVWDMQKNTSDFMEMLLDTSVFFMERGYAAILNKDMSLLLYEDADAESLEHEYALLCTVLPLLEAGKIPQLQEWGEDLVDSQDFENRLEKLIGRIINLIKVERNPMAKNVFTNKLVILSKVRTALIMCQKAACIREKPYGILIYGPSAVAKSKLNATIMKCVLHHNGYANSKDNIVTLNDSDKFQSEYRTWHTGVTMDDFGNTKVEHYETCPTSKIIDFLNNVPKSALNPNVDLKGNVMIQPKVVSVTTNVKTLLSQYFSNEPVSILRRFNVILDVKLRPECTDYSDGGPLISSLKGFLPDAWSITLQTVRIVRATNPQSKDTYEFVDHGVDMSLYECIEWMKTDSAIHFAAQTHFVNEVEDMYAMELCEHSYDPKECPQCLSSAHNINVAEFERLEEEKRREENSEYYDSDGNIEEIEETDTVSVVSIPSIVDVEDVSDEALLPYGNPIFEEAIATVADIAQEGVEQHVCDSDEDDGNSTDSSVIFTPFRAPLSFLRAFNSQSGEADAEYECCFPDESRRVVDQGYLDFVDAYPGDLYPEDLTLKEQVKRWYDQCRLPSATEYVACVAKTFLHAFQLRQKEIAAFACATFAAAGLVYAARRLYKVKNQVDNILEFHGNVIQMPRPLETDVVNPWKKVEYTAIPKTKCSKSINLQEIMTFLERRIGHVFVYDGDRRKKCDIIPLCNNVWMIPGHMVEDKEYRIEVQTTLKSVLGKNPVQVIGPEMWYRIPNTDFLIFRLYSGGDVADITKFFPAGDFKLGTDRVFASSVWKDSEGICDFQKFQIVKQAMVETKNKATFPGLIYDYPKPTFEGQCMMPVVTYSKSPCILGFHLAGRTGESLGACGIITKPQIDIALQELYKCDPLTCHSAGTMLTAKYDIDFTPKRDIAPSHCVKWLADDEATGQQPIGEIYGEHPLGTVSFHSDVRKSVISDSVTKHLALPRIHGAPDQRNINQHWQRDLALISHPRGEFRPSIMKKAMDDFQLKIDTFLDKNPAALERVHPYPKDVVLAGVDGVTSVDGLDLTTSMSFPINKKKKNFIKPSDRVVPGITRPLDIEDKYWDEVLRIEAELLKEERIYSIFRGNLKDEPVKYTKKKIRVFAGCEFALICLTRKYYLSIIRLIQTNWIDFECAVGINAAGPEWTTLVEHITKFGGERMIAGDYKAFDKAATPEIMLASFHMLIHIAERAGYSEDQLMIMHGIATEISLPIYEYNGVLLQAFGSNPSGHSLTVIINNMNNSQYLRYTYYDLHEDDKEDPPPFDEAVALICYGDDNIMDVISTETKFNHTSVAASLAKIGVVYTMADKLAESIPYVSLSETSFLKRGFVYSHDTMNWMAPLDEQSISKSLHNYMNRKGVATLPEQVAADSICGALREYYNHGRAIYDDRRDQLQCVAEECNISELIREMPTFDAMTDYYLNPKKHKVLAEDQPSTVYIG